MIRSRSIPALARPRRGRLALFGLALVLVALSGAVCPDHENISGTGTVRHIDLEGGFYGIVADDSTHYDPVNLAPEFQSDGLRVRFRARVAKDRVSFHMWAPMVEIVSIERL